MANLQKNHRTAENHWNTLWTQETLRDEQGHFWHCRVWLLDPQLLVRSSDLGDLPSWELPHCKWICRNRSKWISPSLSLSKQYLNGKEAASSLMAKAICTPKLAYLCWRSFSQLCNTAWHFPFHFHSGFLICQDFMAKVDTSVVGTKYNKGPTTLSFFRGSWWQGRIVQETTGPYWDILGTWDANCRCGEDGWSFKHISEIMRCTTWMQQCARMQKGSEEYFYIFLQRWIDVVCEEVPELGSLVLSVYRWTLLGSKHAFWRSGLLKIWRAPHWFNPFFFTCLMHGTQWPSKFVSLGDLVDSASILFWTLLQTFESEILQQLAVATKSEVENTGSLQPMMSAAVWVVPRNGPRDGLLWR